MNQIDFIDSFILKYEPCPWIKQKAEYYKDEQVDQWIGPVVSLSPLNLIDRPVLLNV